MRIESVCLGDSLCDFVDARISCVCVRLRACWWPGCVCLCVSVSRPPSLGVSGARFVVPPLAVCSSAAVVVGVTSSPCLELSFIYIYAMLRVNGGGVKH